MGHQVLISGDGDNFVLVLNLLPQVNEHRDSVSQFLEKHLGFWKISTNHGGVRCRVDVGSTPHPGCQWQMKVYRDSLLKM